jgi:uncharacterized membrane protein
MDNDITDQDLRDLKLPHPAERGIAHEDTDRVARRFGKKCFRWGLGIAGTSLLAALSAAVIAGDKVIEAHPDGRLFSGLAIIAGMALGAGLTIIGGVDRLIRPLRATDRIITANIKNRATSVERLTALAETFDERLAAIEAAMDAVAEHLPENQKIHNWRGFGAAARQGFTEKTGTDGEGIRQQPPRLGLVGRDEPFS